MNGYNGKVNFSQNDVVLAGKLAALGALEPSRAADGLCYNSVNFNLLKNVLETELDNARIDGCGGDLPERIRIIPPHGAGISELGGIKGIVKLCPELESMAFSYRCIFDNRNIPVKLAGTANNAYSRIAPSGAIAIDPAGWQRTECVGVHVAGPAAFSAQPVMDIAGCRD